MQDDLIEAMAENIRYDPRTPWIADSDLTFIARAAYAVITDRIAALEAKLAEKDAQLAEAWAENEKLREALGLIIENESPDTGYGNSSAKIARAALGDWKSEAGDLGGDHVR